MIVLRHKESLMVISLLLSSGCGGWTVNKARRALQLSAEAVQATDEVATPRFHEAVTQAVAESETREEFAERIAPWYAVVAAVEGIRESLESAESVVDAWESTQSEAGWIGAMGCLVDAMIHLKLALEGAGVSIPGSISSALDFAVNLGRGLCEPAQAEETEAAE